MDQKQLVRGYELRLLCILNYSPPSVFQKLWQSVCLVLLYIRMSIILHIHFFSCDFLSIRVFSACRRYLFSKTLHGQNAMHIYLRTSGWEILKLRHDLKQSETNTLLGMQRSSRRPWPLCFLLNMPQCVRPYIRQDQPESTLNNGIVISKVRQAHHFLCCSLSLHRNYLRRKNEGLVYSHLWGLRFRFVWLLVSGMYLKDVFQDI